LNQIVIDKTENVDGFGEILKPGVRIRHSTRMYNKSLA